VLNSSYYKLEYTFNGDGTYNFKAERWGGYIKSNEFWTTVENGTFTVAGDRLTITPAKSILTIRNRSGGVISSRNNRLESASYLWKIHYFAGINETELVLQTERETNRDGLFASNDDFPNSYLLSQSYKPDWRF